MGEILRQKGGLAWYLTLTAAVYRLALSIP